MKYKEEKNIKVPHPFELMPTIKSSLNDSNTGKREVTLTGFGRSCQTPI